jgi:putative membrane protein
VSASGGAGSLEAGMNQLIGVLALACAVGGAPLAAQPPAKTAQGTAQSGSAAGAPQGTTPGADAMFVRTAAMDEMAEVEHGGLAGQNATNDEVKQFAQRMVDDHGKAGDELKGLASGKNVTLPTELDANTRRCRTSFRK